MKAILAAMLVLCGGFAWAGDKIEAIDLDGRVFSGALITFGADNRVTLASPGLTPTSFTFDNLACISFDSPATPSAITYGQPYFRITLVSRDILYGVISDTAKNGFAVYNGLLGAIPLDFEQISAIERMDARESLALKIMDGVRKAEREDTVLLMSGDMDSGVALSLSSENISIRSTLYNKDRTYKIVDVRAINLFSFPAARPGAGIPEAVVCLKDNSRLNGFISQTGSSLLTLWRDKSSYQIRFDAIGFIYFKDGNCVYLSDLAPVQVSEYISLKGKTSDFLWRYQSDRGLFSRKNISIRGREYFKGLAAHANCELVYELDGAYRKFLSLIGLTDESDSGTESDLAGSVLFAAYLDGKKVFESGILRKEHPAKEMSLDVTGAKELKLVISDAGDGYIRDRAAWALARLIK